MVIGFSARAAQSPVAEAQKPNASGTNTPIQVLSLSQLDRASYKAGPAPMDSEPTLISLEKSASEAPSAQPVFSLDGEWQLLEDGTEQERLTGSWEKAIKAPVPGSVHTALHRAGIIPDPYLGKNQSSTKPWSFKTYYYRKTFARPPKGQDQTLVFDGVCNICTIWLNGKLLGHHEGMFTSIRYPIGDQLQDTNTLVVMLAPSVADWKKSVVFNNSFGWHYSMFPPLGIWQSVRIQGEPEVAMQWPFIATEDAKAGVVDLKTTITGADQGWSGKLVGIIAPDNFKGEAFRFEQDVESASKSKDVHLRFTIPGAKLWWPVDMGDPNLYKLRLTFSPKGNAKPDVHDITFGIRTVEMAPVNGKPSPRFADWTFVINGQPMFVKGTGWCTKDAMMDFSRPGYDRLLSLAASQHIQMLRAWGSGMVETEDFYDLCNRKGIMVMQEWPTAWNSHQVQPFDLLEKTVREGTLRLRNHPSLVMYAGGNESGSPYGPAIDMMGKLNIELDGTRAFHRGEPWGGSQHEYSFYWYDGPIDQVFTMISMFWGEFGVASYPVLESTLRFLPKEEQEMWPPPKDGAMAFHTPIFNAREDFAHQMRMSQFFTSGTNMEKFVIGTQLAQAVGVRHALERARTRWPESTGALYYKLNDNCPAASWSSVDWYGAPKIAHYLIQDSFAPLVAVCLFPRANSYLVPLALPVFLLDDADALKDARWEVVVRAYGGDLKEIKEARFPGQGSIGKVKSLGDFSLGRMETKVAPLLMVMDVLKEGTLVQRNYNFTNFESERDCLFNMARTTLTAQKEGDSIMVKNIGRLPAVGVNASRPGHLDAFTVQDNYFWLDAGESKTLKVNSIKGVTVEAWNADRAEIQTRGHL